MSGDTVDTLDALSTEELRVRAFHLARENHDLAFFRDLIQHLPHSIDAETLDGSLGSVGASMSDLVSIWREFTGHGYGDMEPIARAAFIDYITKHHD
jgi:hypothetical protein